MLCRATPVSDGSRDLVCVSVSVVVTWKMVGISFEFVDMDGRNVVLVWSCWLLVYAWAVPLVMDANDCSILMSTFRLSLLMFDSEKRDFLISRASVRMPVLL